MKKWLNGKILRSLCVAVVLAVELLLLMDVIVVFGGGAMSLASAAGLLVVLTVAAFWAALHYNRQTTAVTVILPVLLAAFTACSVACWKIFSADAQYQGMDAGKNQIYGGRRVMLIVPHQDDDLNILGGVLEEYARYGSEIYPVFVTNGDYYGLAETRYVEAVQVFQAMGVPEDHVIFLGYGDSWKDGGPHLYNAEPGVVMESFIGNRETYGTQTHPAYREGRAYTIGNLMEDLEAVILEYRPDILFCSDYDHHIDHKSTTLLFEKVMGNILKQNPQYRPVVYKAYAYGTAWEAEPDFYTENILSTRNHFAEPYEQTPAVYRWEDRVRFPVKGEGLSRSLVSTEGYRLLGLYQSQDANWMAASVVNGDKVAWQRHTDSLCLSAQIAVSSGNGNLLNDFMLIENNDLVDASHMPYDGVWIPDGQDDEKRADVTLDQTGPLAALVLYDHPSEEHNVLNAVVTFNDGTQLETGPLEPGGAATRIAVEKENISSFSVELTQIQGELAGLSEVEAFAEYPEPEGKFIKLMDREENFLYDYRTDPDGSGELLLYTHGALPAITEENYHVGIAGGTGSAVLDGGVIRFSCPRGGAFVLNITCDAAGVSDSIYVRNPGTWEQGWSDFWQKAEESIFIRFSRADEKKLLVFSIPEKIGYVLRHLG